jgi:acyl-coenzyme A thioesterase PaaI-like protein
MAFTDMTAGRLRWAMNTWPPLFFAGIRVTELSEDWRMAEVRLKLTRWNRNYVGTQFGGSLFAMTDPFWMLLMLNRIGPGYIVWDKAAEIDFVTPGRGDVFARFDLDDARLAAFKASADAKPKHLEWFEVEVKDAAGTVVARVRKQLYVRRKNARKPVTTHEATA